MGKRTKKSKERVNALILIIAICIILLVASTYAWFSTQKNVSITNLEGRVEVAEGLQISLDAKTWSQEIPLGGIDEGGKFESDWSAYDLGIGNDVPGYKTTNYRPLSPEGGTGSNSIGYMNVLSSSGKLSTTPQIIIPLYTGVFSGTSLRKIEQVAENAEGGVYAFDIYLMNTTKTDNPDQLQLNFNSVVKELLAENGNDYGLKNCIRVAFGLFDATTHSDANQETIVKTTSGTESKISQIAIWEPNFDQHSAFVMRQNPKLKELTNGVSVNATGLNTYALITGITNGTVIPDVYNKSDANLQEQVVNQTTGNCNENVLLNGVKVTGNDTGVLDLKDTAGGNFKLLANTVSKVRVYIWLEGQDPDCINWASHSGGIRMNIGLCKGSEVGQKTEPED